MTRFLRLVIVGCLLGSSGWLLGLGADTAWAQPTSDAPVRSVDATANLFASLETSRPIGGIEVDLPRTWRLVRAVVLRYGSESVPVQVQADNGRILVRADTPLRGPLDVVLQVETAAQTGQYRWSMTPFVAKPDGRRKTLPSLRNEQRVSLHAPSPPNAENPALQFRSAERPVQVPAEELPSLTGQSPFTVEFWLQTTTLDAVVMSTWTGEESQPYPVEVVVDNSGRLRAYTGRPNQHSMLLAQSPVADGAWHHVAVVHDPEDRRLRLYVDGQVADSLTGVPVASPLRPTRLAVGGRLSSRERLPTDLFEGTLDEVGLWSVARSSADIRRSMRVVPGGRLGGGNTSALHRLEAETGTTPSGETRTLPRGVERVGSTLPVRERLDDLHARAQSGQVTLEWTGPTDNLQRYVVERSVDGQSFREAATVDPREAVVAGADSPRFTFTDESVTSQIVFYRIRQVFSNGSERLSGTLKVGLGEEPADTSAVRLIGNFPNPFTERTTVTFEVHESVDLALTVWDLTGQQVAQLADGRHASGYYELTFDAGPRPSGTYFLRLTTPSGTQSHRMVLLK